VHSTAQAAVGRGDHTLGTHDLREALDALRDEVGVFDDVRGMADHTGDEDEIVGNGGIRPHAELVLMTDVGGLERD
jgi:hypothetical protein